MNNSESMILDTHSLIKKLTDVGVPEPHAEAYIGVMNSVVGVINSASQDQFVTKRHFDDKMHTIEIRFKDLENTLTLRMGAMLFIGITVVAALVKIL